MKTNEDIERYLLNMGRDYTSPQPGMWIIHDEFENVDNIIVVSDHPVITFRVKLMDVPQGEARHTLFERLLSLNAEMLTGAYGVADGAVVIVDTLQSENLDQNEFAAAIDGLALAISLHYPALKEFRAKDAGNEMNSEMVEFDKKLAAK